MFFKHVFQHNNFQLTACRNLFFLLLIQGLLLLSATFAAEPMLPQTYTGQVDIRGWLMSEKLDGIRGYWNGRRLSSKNGYLFDPPAKFISNFPAFPLEGELWSGRVTFEQTASAVRSKHTDSGWEEMKFAIFDVPEAFGGFTERIKIAENWFSAHPSRYAFVIPQIPLRDEDHLRQELRQIENLGGEGLIVRKADALYNPGRSSTILKVKSYRDAEATVIAHFFGEGNDSDRLRSLLVKTGDGTEFRIGTGFSDKERKNPPAMGEVITFKYYGKYQSGIPKFPVFLRIMHDKEL